LGAAREAMKYRGGLSDLLNPEGAKRAARRQKGLILGATGLALLFAPAIGIVLSILSTTLAVAVMLVGVLLLVAGFITLPGGLGPKV